MLTGGKPHVANEIRLTPTLDGIIPHRLRSGVPEPIPLSFDDTRTAQRATKGGADGKPKVSKQGILPGTQLSSPNDALQVSLLSARLRRPPFLSDTLCSDRTHLRRRTLRVRHLGNRQERSRRLLRHPQGRQLNILSLTLLRTRPPTNSCRQQRVLQLLKARFRRRQRMNRIWPTRFGNCKRNWQRRPRR